MFPNDFGVVLRLTDDATIADAFKELIDHQMMSIPIVDSTTGRPIFVLSMMHIATHLLKQFQPEDFKDDLWHKIQNLFWSSSGNFFNTKLRDLEVKGELMRDTAHTIDENAPLIDALKMMNAEKCHRVLVTNARGEIVNIITQSRIVQFLSVMIDMLPNANKSIQELGIGLSHVECVSENDLAYSAFKKMLDNSYSALGVVNSEGYLVGNISINDLKLIGYKTSYWNLLGKPVSEYLKNVRSAPEAKLRSATLTLLQQDEYAYPVVVKAGPYHSFGWVLRLIAFYRVHRCYITNESGEPLGVITLTDILGELLKNESVQNWVLKERS